MNKPCSLSIFLRHIQPFYPLFRQTCLQASYEAGLLPRGLLLAIFSVSACFCVRAEIVALGNLEVSAACASRVRQIFPNNTISGSTATLDDIKTLFLLGLHDFRNSSSRKAWLTISNVARLAYSVGLHQVDNPTNCALYTDVSTPEEMEEWRYVWWSIYVLDCCCNVTFATPSGIEMDSLRTALPSTSTPASSENRVPAPAKLLFIGGEPGSSSTILKELFTQASPVTNCNEFDMNFKVRILGTYELREASSLLRLIHENPGPKIQDRLRLLRSEISATRLSLPLWYLDPGRSTSAGETRPQHMARLINLFELHLTTLIVSLPNLTGDGTKALSAWQRDWDVSLGLLEDMVAIVRAWDPRYAPMSDPAVCFIVFTTLVLLDTDLRLELERPASKARESSTQASLQLLRLFLERLAHYHQLPKVLLGMLEHILRLFWTRFHVLVRRSLHIHECIYERTNRILPRSGSNEFSTRSLDAPKAKRCFSDYRTTAGAAQTETAWEAPSATAATAASTVYL